MVAEASVLGRVMDILAEIPTAEEVLDIKITASEQKRLEYLNQQNREGNLSPDEKAEYDSFFLAEHLVQMAKARAFGKTISCG